MDFPVSPTNASHSHSLVQSTKSDASAQATGIKPCEPSQGDLVNHGFEPLPADVPISKRKTTHCDTRSDKGKKETSVASTAGDKKGVSDKSASPEASGRLHQLHDHSANFGNETDIPDIRKAANRSLFQKLVPAIARALDIDAGLIRTFFSSLSISEENTSEACRSEKTIKENYSAYKAATLPEALTTQIPTLSLSGQDTTNKANNPLTAPEPALDKKSSHGMFEYNRLHEALLDKGDESVETLERLLAKDRMDPNARCPYPKNAPVTPGMLACSPLFLVSLGLLDNSKVSLKKAELLLQHGAEPDAPIFNRGLTETLLSHLVIFSNSPELVSQHEKLIRLLGTYGADLEKEDERGKTPLGIAISWENVPIINLLLDLGAKVDASKGADYLKLAIVFRMTEIFRRLLGYDGVDPNASEQLASWALDFAIATTAKHDMDLITPLVNKQVDLNRRYGERHSPLLRTLLSESGLGYGRFKVAAILIAHGADLELWEDLSEESKQSITEEKFWQFEDFFDEVTARLEARASAPSQNQPSGSSVTGD